MNKQFGFTDFFEYCVFAGGSDNEYVVAQGRLYKKA